MSTCDKQKYRIRSAELGSSFSLACECLCLFTLWYRRGDRRTKSVGGRSGGGGDWNHGGNAQSFAYTRHCLYIHLYIRVYICCNLWYYIQKGILCAFSNSGKRKSQRRWRNRLGCRPFCWRIRSPIQWESAEAWNASTSLAFAPFHDPNVDAGAFASGSCTHRLGLIAHVILCATSNHWLPPAHVRARTKSYTILYLYTICGGV